MALSLWSHVGFVGSSERWRVEKPAAAFLDRVVERAAGLCAMPGEVTIDSLVELPEALERV